MRNDVDGIGLSRINNTARYGSGGQWITCLATILVTRDGLVSQEAMWLYSWFVDRAEWRAPVPIHSGFVKQTGMPFYVATGQRASLDMRVALAQADFSLLPTPGTATFTISALPTRQAFDSDVSLSCVGLPARVMHVHARSRHAGRARHPRDVDDRDARRGSRHSRRHVRDCRERHGRRGTAQHVVSLSVR